MSTDTRDALIARLEHTPSLPSAWPFPDAPVVVPARLWREHLDDVVEAARLLREDGERGGPLSTGKRGPLRGVAEVRELLCMLCGRDYPVWFAPNELWNRVVREPDGSDRWSFLCPGCFATRAAMAGATDGRALVLSLEGDHPDLRADNDRLRLALEQAGREVEIMRKQADCIAERREGTFGIRVDSDVPARVWQALEQEREKLEGTRLAKLRALAHPDAGSEARERETPEMCTFCGRQISGPEVLWSIHPGRCPAPAGTSTLLAAIDAEPELSGEMPDEMWEELRSDRQWAAEALRAAVRKTKQGIRARVLAALRGEEVGNG